MLPDALPDVLPDALSEILHDPQKTMQTLCQRDFGTPDVFLGIDDKYENHQQSSRPCAIYYQEGILLIRIIFLHRHRVYPETHKQHKTARKSEPG